jgi:hypothetical protein
MMTSGSRSVSDDPLRVLADALAPYLAERLRSPLAAAPEFYSQLDSPLGRRRHLTLVRRRVLFGHKEGRLVLVRRAEVHAHIERQGRCSERPATTDDSLSDWGLTPRGER